MLLRIIVMVMGGCGAGAAMAAGISIARDGASEYVIVTRERAHPAEQTAAEELQEHLKLVTGATLPIVAESSAGEKPKLVISISRELANDAISIKTAGRDVHLSGAPPRGAIYAVHTFLEDHVGVRWWTHTESTIPKKPTLTIPSTDFKYEPKLRYRETFHSHVLAGNHAAAVRMKLNGHFSRIPRGWGDHYNIIGWCHTVYELLHPNEYFAKHPEWYSMHNGKRTADHGQMCWTNAEMQKEMAKRALQRIRKNPNAGIISISQNDWQGPCTCPDCKAIDDANGGAHSGSLITGINAIAAIVAREYPDFLIETLAYQYTRKPPTQVKPAKNVLVRLCSIECNFAQPLRSEANKSFGDDLRNWSKVADNLFIWNYVTNFSSYVIPHPNLRPIADDLRFFVDHNVVGVFEQADSQNQLAGDMLPLRCWVQAKLLWNPSLDQEALTREFAHGYYGPAGPHLLEYLKLVNAPAKKATFSRGCYSESVKFLSAGAVAQCVAHFDAAEKAVASDTTLLARVKRERLALEHVQLLQWDFAQRIAERAAEKNEDPDTAASAVCRDYESAAKEWCRRAVAAGVRNYSEGTPFPAYQPNLIMRYQRFVPAKLPKPGEPLPAGAVDIQESAFQLPGRGDWVELADDETASDGKAARMPGTHTNWAVQYHIPKDATNFGKGPWRVYFVVRTKLNRQPAGVFRYGLHDANINHPVAMEGAGTDVAGDEKYHAYGLWVEELKPGMYFWVSPIPNGATEAVYVDRIYCVPAAGAEEAAK